MLAHINSLHWQIMYFFLQLINSVRAMKEDPSTHHAIAHSLCVYNKQLIINLMVTLVHVWNAVYSGLKWLKVGSLVSSGGNVDVCFTFASYHPTLSVTISLMAIINIPPHTSHAYLC